MQNYRDAFEFKDKCYYCVCAKCSLKVECEPHCSTCVGGMRDAHDKCFNIKHRKDSYKYKRL